MDLRSNGEAQESPGEGVTFGAATGGVVALSLASALFPHPGTKKKKEKNAQNRPVLLIPTSSRRNCFINGELRTQRRRLGDREAGDVSVWRGTERRRCGVNFIVLRSSMLLLLFFSSFSEERARSVAARDADFFFSHRGRSRTVRSPRLLFSYPPRSRRVEWFGPPNAI